MDQIGTTAQAAISNAASRRTGSSAVEPRADARLNRASVALALRTAHHEAHHLSEVRRRGGTRRGDRLVDERVDLVLGELLGEPRREHLALLPLARSEV